VLTVLKEDKLNGWSPYSRTHWWNYSMPAGIFLFTGAPLSSSLDWQESGLLGTFCEPVARFLHLGDPTHDEDVVPMTPVSEPVLSSHPSWRSLALERYHLATGLSQDHGWRQEFKGASFLTTSDITSFIEDMSKVHDGHSQRSLSGSAEVVLSQFYKRSYAIHEDIASSQLGPASAADTSFNSEQTSLDNTDTYYDSTSPARSFEPAKTIPMPGRLRNLEDIPNAMYLDSIQPQTMTVDLVVGIISIPSSRSIVSRRGANVELIEVLVGDETRSGFGINFWLPAVQSAEQNLRSTLSELRPQDIVLMRNVALNSFRGKVYGQSLRREVTRVHLLYRNRIDSSDVGGCYSAADLVMRDVGDLLVKKTRKVREWVLQFVGIRHMARKGKGQALEGLKEVLPPDTQ